MPKMLILPKHVMALGGYIRERTLPYGDYKFPYRNIIVGNPKDEPVKIDVPVYDISWIEKHENLGLIIVPVKEDDDFVGLFNMVKEKIRLRA